MVAKKSHDGHPYFKYLAQTYLLIYSQIEMLVFIEKMSLLVKGTILKKMRVGAWGGG